MLVALYLENQKGQNYPSSPTNPLSLSLSYTIELLLTHGTLPTPSSSLPYPSLGYFIVHCSLYIYTAFFSNPLSFDPGNISLNILFIFIMEP